MRRFNEDVVGSAEAGSSEESSELDPELVRSFQRSLLGAGVIGGSDESADVSSLDVADLAELAGGGRAILRSGDGEGGGTDDLRRELEEYGVDPAELGMMMASVASKRPARQRPDAERQDAAPEPGFAPGDLLPYSEEGAEGAKETAGARGAGDGGTRGFWTSEESSGPDDAWVDDVWTRLRRRRAQAGGAPPGSGSDTEPVNEALAAATGGRVRRWADVVSPAFPAAPGCPPAWFTPTLARELAACLPEGFPIATVPSHAELCGAASLAPPLCQKEMIRCVLEARTAFRDDAWVERQMQKLERNSRSILAYENAVQMVLRGDDPAVAEAAEARRGRARRAAAARASRNPETVERATLRRLRERLTAGSRAMAAIRRRQRNGVPTSHPPRHVSRLLADLHRRQLQWTTASAGTRRGRRWARGHRLASHALRRQSLGEEGPRAAGRLHVALEHWTAAEARRGGDPLAAKADAESARMLAALRQGPGALAGYEEEEEGGENGAGVASAAITLGEDDWEAAEAMAVEQREAEVTRYLMEASRRQAAGAGGDVYDLDEADTEGGGEEEGDSMVVDEPTEYAESTDDVAGEEEGLTGHAAAVARARRELGALERDGASGRRAQLLAVQRRLQAETGAEQVSVAPRGPSQGVDPPGGGAGGDMQAIVREAFKRAGMSAHLDSVEGTLGVGLDDLLVDCDEASAAAEGGEVEVGPPPRQREAAARSSGSKRTFATWARTASRPTVVTPRGAPCRSVRALATAAGGGEGDDVQHARPPAGEADIVDGVSGPERPARDHAVSVRATPSGLSSAAVGREDVDGVPAAALGRDFDHIRDLDAARRLNPLRVEPEDRVATRDPLALRRRNRRSRVQRGLQRSLGAEVERDDPLAACASPRQQRVATRIQETVDRVLEVNTLRSRLLARTAPHVTHVSISPCMKHATVRWVLPQAIPSRGACWPRMWPGSSGAWLDALHSQSPPTRSGAWRKS